VQGVEEVGEDGHGSSSHDREPQHRARGRVRKATFLQSGRMKVAFLQRD
jgi:hypothetical protein